MKTSFLTALFSIAALAALAAPPTAERVLSGAKSKAASENKAVFVHFGASWCHWCKRLDEFLDRPEIKSRFEKSFVPVTLVVSENAKNKNLENAGGDKVLKGFGGEGAGIPFSAFLDKDGKLIVSSMRPAAGGRSANIGYPGGPEEIDWFVAMMKKAAPRMAEADLKVIETALREKK